LTNTATWRRSANDSSTTYDAPRVRAEVRVEDLPHRRAGHRRRRAVDVTPNALANFNDAIAPM
jgi:hypothetical protein